MPREGHTYTRRIGGQRVEVARAYIADHLPAIAALAGAGLCDREIGERLGLSGEQVRGLRGRADPPIKAARPRGRPRVRPAPDA